jgi:hypothetical protein
MKKFRKEHDSKDDLLIAVDPEKFDRAWQKDKDCYVGPGGTEHAIAGRYARFQQWLKNNPDTPINAAEVFWDPATNSPRFFNGRHRFAVLRDLGMKVYIVVPKHQVRLFKHVRNRSAAAAI